MTEGVCNARSEYMVLLLNKGWAKLRRFSLSDEDVVVVVFVVESDSFSLFAASVV